uniref:Uncharacterized protein n=1 Tax=Oryza sativa subsp. japonica TaxID=39947 RepID=Q2QPF2_ORYSJ|nr:hypothetical protein LOC_Os12g34680 [Oryza sativa Japonica Group]
MWSLMVSCCSLYPFKGKSYVLVFEYLAVYTPTNVKRSGRFDIPGKCTYQATLSLCFS